MFSTEKDFARSLSAKLKKHGYNVTRLESHSTGNGIPDMFVQGHGKDIFLELKNCPKVSVLNQYIKIPYRPGQVAWMYDYYLCHLKKKWCKTVIALCDGYLIINNVSGSLSGTISMEAEYCKIVKDLDMEELLSMD